MAGRRSFVAAFVLVLALAVPQPSTLAAVTGNVSGVSHNHPPGRTFSWLGARISTTPGATVSVFAEHGVPMTRNPVRCRAGRRGKVLAVWKVDVGGSYEIHATITKDGSTAERSELYRVPFPPFPEWGPFRFRRDAGCHRGWPRS